MNKFLSLPPALPPALTLVLPPALLPALPLGLPPALPPVLPPAALNSLSLLTNCPGLMVS